MSSEKTKADYLMRKKICLLMDSVNIDIRLPENHKFLVSFWLNIEQLLADDERQMEAIEFIIQNKPRDLMEINHFLNMFCLQACMTRVMIESRTVVSDIALQDYVKLVVKCTSTFGGAMVALSAYRNGVSVTKHTTNFQNNNLTQVNLGQPINSKIDVKEVKQGTGSISAQVVTEAIEAKETFNIKVPIKLKKNEKVST